MEGIYDASYYEDYYQLGNGILYSEKNKWYPLFDTIAQRLIDNYHPKVTLDVGCAYGYLVEALREKGVEAYGIDISEYAIGQVDESVKAYVRVNSASAPLPENFPKHFDVITSIEVLEHMTVEDGEKALERLCKLTDVFVFSSTDTDLKDATHINVQRKEYWAKIFAKYGFFRDVQISASYINECADVYRRRNDICNVIQEYEVMLRIAKEYPLGRRLSSQIYYDFGDGFREENKIVIENAIIGEKIEFALELPLNTRAVRFDPTEKFLCVLSDLSIRLGGKEQKMEVTNGMVCGNMIFFDTADPQIVVRTNQTGCLTVIGEIYLLEDIQMNAATLFGIMKKMDEERIREWTEIKKTLLKQKKAIERGNQRVNWIQTGRRER